MMDAEMKCDADRHAAAAQALRLRGGGAMRTIDRLCYVATRLLPAACWVGRGRMWIAVRAWRHANVLDARLTPPEPPPAPAPVSPSA